MKFVNSHFVQQRNKSSNGLIILTILLLLVSQIVLAHHKIQHITQNFEATCSFCIVPMCDDVAYLSEYSISLLNPKQINLHTAQFDVADSYTFFHYSPRAPPMG